MGAISNQRTKEDGTQKQRTKPVSGQWRQQPETLICLKTLCPGTEFRHRSGKKEKLEGTGEGRILFVLGVHRDISLSGK